MECIRLAGAFDRRGPRQSGSKLRALQTLRAVRPQLASLMTSRPGCFGSGFAGLGTARRTFGPRAIWATRPNWVPTQSC